MSKKVLIDPTKEEEKEWKEVLYNTLVFLATEREDFMPDKDDSFETLKDSFFSWASEYNGGYFSEMDEADTDRYCAYITQEFIRWNDYSEFKDLYYDEDEEEDIFPEKEEEKEI